MDALGVCIAGQPPQVAVGAAVPGWGVLLQVPELQHKALQGREQALQVRVPAAAVVVATAAVPAAAAVVAVVTAAVPAVVVVTTAMAAAAAGEHCAQ